MASSALKNKKGITLIELIVSIALFSLAVIVVLTILSTGINAQRKVIALQNVQENARALLEFIAKEVRMGIVSSAGTDYINITRSDGDVVRYTFSNGDIIRNNITDNLSGAMNSTNINITGSFYVTGLGTADNLQPKITIVLSVQSQGSKVEEQARIDLQTTLSQRNLDLP